MKMDFKYEELIEFHGHSCPGLAIGYRMTKAALSRLSDIEAEDEAIVAIVENDACGVDALQCLTGCTFGKNNLIFKDYGKNVYTLFSRKSKKGVRVLFIPDNIPEDVREDRERFKSWLLAAPESEVVAIRDVVVDEPEPETTMKSVACEYCGEYVLETRTRKLDTRIACIPCDRKHRKS